MGEDLYQSDLMRLATEAHGQGRLEAADATITLDNPLCGDRITLDVRVSDGRLEALGHEVKACVLCQAAASLIGRHAVGESSERLHEIARTVHTMLKPGGAGDPSPDAGWPGIAAFAPAVPLKSRHACIELPFKALVAALDAAAQGRRQAG